MALNAYNIIDKHYKHNSKSFKIYILHAESVKNKALEIAGNVPELNPDLKFIEQSALLHDIGIKFTYSPDIGCKGKNDYIMHGILGKQLLDNEGFQKYGSVCERHIGVGLTKQDIISQKLPLPLRNMAPITIEEEIICLADKFFSKNPLLNGKQRTLKQAQEHIAKLGSDKLKIFDKLCKKYKINLN